MKMAASASPADRQRVETMMAQRRTLNPNQRTAAPGGAPAAPPKPAWMQLREQGIAGQGSAAANKAALAGQMTRSGPIMDPSRMRPGGGMAPRPMTPEMVAQAQAAGPQGAARTDMPGARPMPAPPMGLGPGANPSGDWKTMLADQGALGGQVSAENQGPGGGGWSPERMAGAGGFEGPGNGMPPGLGGLPPEIMQRLQAMRMPQQGGAPGMPPDPSGGRGFGPAAQGAYGSGGFNPAGGFAPPGQGAPGAAPRPYGLQSFYGA